MKKTIFIPALSMAFLSAISSFAADNNSSPRRLPANHRCLVNPATCSDWENLASHEQDHATSNQDNLFNRRHPNRVPSGISNGHEEDDNPRFPHNGNGRRDSDEVNPVPRPRNGNGATDEQQAEDVRYIYCQERQNDPDCIQHNTSRDSDNSSFRNEANDDI